MLNFHSLTLSDDTDDTDKKSCNECGTVGALHCGICDEAHYCSYECQKKAWPTHKQNCNGGQASGNPPPPTDRKQGVVRAIYFNPEADSPGLIWLRYTRIFPGYVSVDLGSVLALTAEEAESQEYEAPMWFDITHDTCFEDVSLPYTIRVHGRDDLSRAITDNNGENEDYDSEGEEQDHEEGKLNKAIRKLSQMPGWAHDWKGPVVVYGIKDFTVDSHPKQLVDLKGGDDLRHLMNFVNSITDPVKMVSCVRVNCNGDVKEKGRPKFERIEIPAIHAIFKQAPTQISEHIELPVAAARIPGSVDFWVNGITGSTMNQAIKFMYQGCNRDIDDKDFMTGGYGWGFAPRSWDVPTGSCIVVRMDKKPLLPEHVEVMGDYCHDYLGVFFQEQMESGFEERDEDDENEEDAESDDDAENDDDAKNEEDDGHDEGDESDGNDNDEDDDNDENEDDEVDEDNGLSRDHVLKEITKDKFEEYFQAWKARQTNPAKRGIVSPYA